MIHAEKVGEWIKVQFKYHYATGPMITSRLKSIQGWFYNPKTKNWGVPYTKRAEFEEKLGTFLVIWKGEKMKYKRDWKVSRDKPLVPYDFKLKPFPYQMEGFNVLVSQEVLILGDDMGLGKSFQILTALAARKRLGQVKKVLYLTKASLLYTVLEEVSKVTDEVGIVVGGSKNKRIKQYATIHADENILFVITSYETYRNDHFHFMDIPFDAMVMDEAHKAKNPLNKIGSFIHKIKCPYKYALTGTPIINNPLDAYNLLKWMGKEKRNWWAFRGRYAILGGYNNKEIIGYKNLPELQDKIQSVLLRRLKNEELELPEKIRQTLYVELTGKQTKLYEAVKKEIKEELADTMLEGVVHPLAKLTRLQQTALSLKILEVEGLNEKQYSAKLNLLKEYLEELCEDSKVVVFTKYKQMINWMMKDKEITQYNPAVITGDINAQAKKGDISDRQKQVNKFQKEDSCRLFLGTIGACKEGLTLTEGNYMFFLDSDWTHAAMSQAEDRIYRIGQKKTANIYYMVARGTVDEVVQKTVLDKEDMFNVLIDLKTSKADRALKTILSEALK